MTTQGLGRERPPNQPRPLDQRPVQVGGRPKEPSGSNEVEKTLPQHHERLSNFQAGDGVAVFHLQVHHIGMLQGDRT